VLRPQSSRPLESSDTLSVTSRFVGLLNRLSTRKTDDEAPVSRGASPAQVFPTKALRKFLTSLTQHESPVLLDLGPVVGGNVSFFGE